MTNAVIHSKELIIPAFSDAAYQLARQRAFDCYNDGIFSIMVSARRYDSLDAFIDCARIADKTLLERAQCRGIILDPLIGEQDFSENTYDVFQKIFSRISLPCFMVKYGGFLRRPIMIVRTVGELEFVASYLCFPHLTCLQYDDEECCLARIDESNDLVVTCGNASESLADSFVGRVFTQSAEAIIIFPPAVVV